MSLAQEPAFSTLKKYCVTGYKDITGEGYAGQSGQHATDGNAIKTTNGAGPHNLQLFILASDGTVLHCLLGYWHPRDLALEIEFARKLNDVWMDPHATRTQKNTAFSRMHLEHVAEHPPDMVARSRMQGFDQKYEATRRLHTSDTIKDRTLLASYTPDAPLPREAFKTTDQIIHERMARRPFLNYYQFDVASYSDYGRPKYEKHEDYRTPDGKLTEAFKNAQQQKKDAARWRKQNRLSPRLN